MATVTSIKPAVGRAAEDEIARKQRRWGALALERDPQLSHYRVLSRFMLPKAGRFLGVGRQGESIYNSIYDSTATRALRVLAAGLMAGMTSPARPWFKLKTPDPDLNKTQAVREWLADTTGRMRDVFNHSNTYRALHSLYEELGCFGTGSCFILPDFEHVIHCTPMTVGEYAIACDAKGNVNTIYRQFDMTVDQLVREFGLDMVTERVRNLYTSGRGLDQWINVMHVVQPRDGGYDVRKPGIKNMAWESCYFETKQNEGRYLRESGFTRFPSVSPRWKVTGTDTYGESPAMEALGDTKQLQHEQLRKGQGIDQLVDPALLIPTALMGQPINAYPGGRTYGDTAQGTGIKTLHDQRIELQPLLEDIQDVRARINDTMYVPLFLMLANEERAEITAREIAERHEEKLLMLGPVLERLHNELLSPLIDITFDRMSEAGLIAPPPQELQGMELKVEFVSMLAQAQQAVGVQAIDRLIGTIGQMAQLGKTDALDKLNSDKIVDAYVDMLGVDPTLILADDEVQAVRAQKAAQQQAMMQAETAPAAAQTAKTLSETDTQGKNGLTDLIRQFSGYSTNPNAG